MANKNKCQGHLPWSQCSPGRNRGFVVGPVEFHTSEGTHIDGCSVSDQNDLPKWN